MYSDPSPVCLIAAILHVSYVVSVGWRRAVVAARNALTANAADHASDPATFRQDLVNIARTTLSSKILASQNDYFAELAVEAVLRLKVRSGSEW